jgi:hypothetical protein
MSMIEKRPTRSVLQDWVMNLGLRYQGALLTVIRGCDTVPKQHPCKDLARAIRALILETHCKDPQQSVSFIEMVAPLELDRRYNGVIRDFDALPLHYVMHLVHATEILGYHHPDVVYREVCNKAYRRFCAKFHMGQESERQLWERLEADEETFGANQ